MKIISSRQLKGPNYWSSRRYPLTQMEIDLENFSGVKSNQIEGFYERLKDFIPSLYRHRCSLLVRGGFFQRVQKGTLLGHIIEHVALQLQTLAGIKGCRRGWTRRYKKGDSRYFVVFQSPEEKSGILAGKYAFETIQDLINGTQDTEKLQKFIDHISETYSESVLGVSTYSIVKEAKNRGIPFFRLNDKNLLQLGMGENQKRIRATVASTTSHIASNIASNKALTKKILDDAYIPVPAGYEFSKFSQLEKIIQKIGFPVVIKPLDGNHGRGVIVNIKDFDSLKEAYSEAKEYSTKLICEKYVVGYDHRILLVDFKLVAGAVRYPAHVIGDGVLNIRQLIEKENQNPLRGSGHSNVLTKITVDEFLVQKILEKGYSLETVVEEGEIVYLKDTANISTGGIAKDITDTICEDNIKIFEKTAKLIGLDICGIDVMCKDITRPLFEKNNGAILEVNAAPGFRMHLSPSSGDARNVAKPVVDMLFKNSGGKIPVIAITGTNGKTTTTKLASYIIQNFGKVVGTTSSDGIYIGNQKIHSGDCSGPTSASIVFKDPTTQVAVLETARGGILRRGLAFDECDISLVTNITPDHMDLEGINTLKKLTRVKAVVPKSTKVGGYCILNADDENVYNIKKNLIERKIGLFSLDPNNKKILRHQKRNGTGAIFEDGNIKIYTGAWKQTIANVKDIPITYGGKASFNISNVLGATLIAFLFGVDEKTIRDSLHSFGLDENHNSGRQNFINLEKNTFLIDHAHNPDGMKKLSDFVKNLDYPKKIGILRASGDRRDEDIISIGKTAGNVFDEILVRSDKNLRGRSHQELTNLLKAGVEQVGKKAKIFESEKEAIKYAYENFNSGELIVVFDSGKTGNIEYIKSFENNI